LLVTLEPPSNHGDQDVEDPRYSRGWRQCLDRAMQYTPNLSNFNGRETADVFNRTGTIIQAHDRARDLGAERPNDDQGHNLTGRHAMACAHRRDNMSASGNMSSPSAGAGRGATPSQPVASRGAGHGVPPRCGASMRCSQPSCLARHVVVRCPSRGAR